MKRKPVNTNIGAAIVLLYGQNIVTYTCMYANTQHIKYTYIYTCKHIIIHAHILYMHIHTHTNTHANTHMHIYACTYTQTHTRVHIHTHTHTNVHISIHSTYDIIEIN